MRKKSWHSPYLKVLKLRIFLKGLVEILVGNGIKVVVDNHLPSLPFLAADYGPGHINVGECIAEWVPDLF